MIEAIETTFRELARIDSPSEQEQQVASYLQKQLISLGLEVNVDEIGNVIGYLPSEGEPILLNAHMDGVPLSKGHVPVKEGDILHSDGSTNLRADDIAGISIILEATRSIVNGKKKHPPLILACTVQEEIGSRGAKALDLTRYHVKRGLVYDNAFKAGVVVSRGAAYVAFDVEIKGKEAHPGKDLSQGVNALSVFLDIGNDIHIGDLDNGRTKLNIGTVSAGKARNVVPGNVTLQGEVRSFLNKEQLAKRITHLKSLFDSAAKRNGAEVTFTTNQLAVAYEIGGDEPLVQKYKHIIEKHGGTFETKETFVASDANPLRGEKGLEVFVVSTGVENDHSVNETVSLSDLELLTKDLISLLTTS
ncbi:MAG TPA: M20/M25/M40 family metallo-hydrolase [Patescibacteria group bacterium]|nr:M20/M25/M40 family metallo-hydrolase [Patescibacteria group bacterium]